MGKDSNFLLGTLVPHDWPVVEARLAPCRYKAKTGSLSLLPGWTIEIPIRGQVRSEGCHEDILCPIFDPSSIHDLRCGQEKARAKTACRARQDHDGTTAVRIR